MRSRDGGGGRKRRGLGATALRPVAALALVSGIVGLPAVGDAQVVPGVEPLTPNGEARNIRVVGHSNLGGAGLNGDVAVVGNTAVVGAGYIPTNTMQNANTLVAAQNIAPPCTTVDAKVVDISDPARPTVAATIPVPPGQAVSDVDALHVSTPSYSGPLVAVAYATCDLDPITFRTLGVVQPGSFAHRGVAYYDVSNPRRPELLGRYMADFENFDPASPGCARPPAGSEARCAQDQFNVELKRIRDGRILSLSGRPDGALRSTPATDVRIVDVTNPRAPTQLGVWPPVGQAPALTLSATGTPERNSPNGCYPRQGSRSATFTPDGTKVLVPYLDGGLFVVDVNDLANPRQVGVWPYPARWDVEGQASHAAVAEVGGRQLSLLADEDWWWPTTAFRVDSPPSLAGLKLGCSDLYTAMDQKYVSQIHRRPGGQVQGELVYVGRGCPLRPRFAGATVPADPYLADPRGKIMFADVLPDPVTQPSLNTGQQCTFNSRVRRAQDDGALGVVIVSRTALSTEAVAGFPPAGTPREPTDQNGALTGDVSIPGMQIKRPDGDALRRAMCPTVVNGVCTGGVQVFGAMVDQPGEWGGLRIIDTTNAAAPREVGQFKTQRALQMPPPDYRGIYAVHHAVVEGDRAYVAWNSDGLRVLDLGSGLPSEIASFVPPDTPDPTGTVPAKARVLGVDYTATHIVVSDINSGLWVLEKPAPFGGRGYWMASADGGVFALGDAPFFGRAPSRLARPIVGLVPTSTGKGYWLVASDGGVFAFGDATFRGSAGGRRLNAPIVGLAPTPTDRGYWLVGADGGVFAFGDAAFYGSTGNLRLNQPIVGMAPTVTGGGYWLAAADGGVFSFGDAKFLGSTGNVRLNRPIVSVARTVNGAGYWLTASDGGVFSFGDARFVGSTGALRLNQPIVSMTPTGNSAGYWLVARDGGVFAFGAPFLGSLAGNQLSAPIVSAASVPR